ncbi:hypothetical protein SprV_0401577100 [Sparganum proliferum]
MADLEQAVELMCQHLAQISRNQDLTLEGIRRLVGGQRDLESAATRRPTTSTTVATRLPVNPVAVLPMISQRVFYALFVDDISLHINFNGRKMKEGLSDSATYEVIQEVFGIWNGDGKSTLADLELSITKRLKRSLDTVKKFKRLVQRPSQRQFSVLLFGHYLKVYTVVEFVNDKSVAATAAKKWFHSDTCVIWVKNSKQRDRLLENNLRLPAGTKVYAVRLLKNNLTLDRALQLTRKAEDTDDLSHSEPTELGRVMRKKFVRQLTSESDHDDEIVA